jgi:hypothetical protein
VNVFAVAHNPAEKKGCCSRLDYFVITFAPALPNADRFTGHPTLFTFVLFLFMMFQP